MQLAERQREILLAIRAAFGNQQMRFFRIVRRAIPNHINQRLRRIHARIHRVAVQLLRGRCRPQRGLRLRRFFHCPGSRKNCTGQIFRGVSFRRDPVWQSHSKRGLQPR